MRSPWVPPKGVGAGRCHRHGAGSVGHAESGQSREHVEVRGPARGPACCSVPRAGAALALGLSDAGCVQRSRLPVTAEARAGGLSRDDNRNASTRSRINR